MSDSLWIERLEAVEAEIKALKASWAPAEFVSLRDRVKELEELVENFQRRGEEE